MGKASVAGQEKKAHENWVAARQAERKLTELQGEMSLLRNKLTVFESRNQLLEQEKNDLTETINMINSVKTEPVASNGLMSAASLDSLPAAASPAGPESLPPLPGLPSSSAPPGLSSAPPSLPSLPALPLLPNPLMVAPMFGGAGGMMSMEMRQPPLGRMSPGPRDNNRSYESRSPSPEYERGYRGERSGYRDSSGDKYRDNSPRSERRHSGARSERGGYRDSNGGGYHDSNGGGYHDSNGGGGYHDSNGGGYHDSN